MAAWSFLTNHARALLCVARDPGVRLRDIAETLGISERRAFGIVTDLTNEGFVVKTRDGRRNRYEVQHHLPLPEPSLRERTTGELLDLLARSASGEEFAIRSARNARVSPARRRHVKEIS